MKEETNEHQTATGTNLNFEIGIEHAPEQPYSAEEIRVFRAPKNTPRMTVKDERSYIRVRPVQASPVSFPDKYIGLLDVKNEEVAFIEDLKDLDEISRQVIQEELARRYLKAKIMRVNSIQMEYGVTYWEAETDRGRREFVTRGHENTYWVTDTRLLLTDVDGNRFEIIDYLKLDDNSIKLIESFV